MVSVKVGDQVGEVLGRVYQAMRLILRKWRDLQTTPCCNRASGWLQPGHSRSLMRLKPA